MPFSVHRLRRVFGTAMILALSGMFGLSALRADAAEPLQVSPEAIYFSVIKPGTTVNRDLVVRNPGSGGIEVRLLLEGAPFSIAVDTMRLAGGAETDASPSVSAPPRAASIPVS
jgi:hypothetical protein